MRAESAVRLDSNLNLTLIKSMRAQIKRTWEYRGSPVIIGGNASLYNSRPSTSRRAMRFVVSSQEFRRLRDIIINGLMDQSAGTANNAALYRYNFSRSTITRSKPQRDAQRNKLG